MKINVYNPCEIGYKGIFGTNPTEIVKLKTGDQFTELENGKWQLTQKDVKETKEFTYDHVNEFASLNKPFIEIDTFQSEQLI